jgi:cytochrome c oxidase cbb3-type subunit 4
MEILHYDSLRHFADSWGLIYMLGIFLTVLAFAFRRGAKSDAVRAAQIPLKDDEQASESDR